MCGRYTLAAPLDELVEVFDVDHSAIDRWLPRFNIGPSNEVPVVILGSGGERRLGLMRWGLVPSWAESPKVGYRMLNARSETVARKPAFREAFEHRRCLLPADGFYEWRVLDDGSARPAKAPYWIHRPGRALFAFAGLWERWRSRDDGDPLVSCTLLTTRANSWMEALHDRMPVLLDAPDAMRLWLEGPAGDLRPLLDPAPSDALEAWEVSTRVNRPIHEGPELIEPVEGGVRHPPGDEDSS